MWERRYGAVTPRRTPGQDRLYSRNDLTRLTLLKQLVDRGHAISTVANMEEPDLRARLSLHDGDAVAVPRTPLTPAEGCRVVLVGDSLPAMFASELGTTSGIELIGTCADLAALAERAITPSPDVLVLEIAAVHPDTADQVKNLLQRCGAKRAVLVYIYAAQAALQRLSHLGIVTLRAPVTAADLRQACHGTREKAEAGATAADRRVSGDIPARLFSNQALARIQNATSTIVCECPHHLVDLIYRLVAFERYSADCENRNDKDAQLHANLHHTTAQARRMIEDALKDVIEADGLDIESPKNTPALAK